MERAQKSIIARYSFIDNYLTDQLRENDERAIVTIGAGFDCRPSRIKGEKWYEIDQKPIIDTKNIILAVGECKNSLSRICADITSADIVDVLRKLNLKTPIFVIEGVLNYFEEREVKELLKNIRKCYSDSLIICDIMNEHFYNKYAVEFRHSLESVGLRYRFLEKFPQEYFERNGWQVKRNLSIPGLAFGAGLIKIPKIIRNLFLKKLLEGYKLYFLVPG